MVESLMELPPNNIEQILSKLPIKSILACRCACKTLMNLTSSFNPHFTALHSSNASQNLIIQFARNHRTRLNSVHLFDARLDINPVSSNEKLRLSPIFKIPDWAKELDSFVLVNACNGLLFFAVTKLKDSCSLVCNPITNEYVRVPELDQKRQLHTQTLSLWLGFSPISRVYKVLRFYVHSPGAIAAANIHDIGSSSWRDVESTPLDNIYWDDSHAVINGIIYWFCQYDFLFCRPAANFIVFFDFESEIFGKIDAPPGFDEYRLQRRYIR